LRTEFLAGDLGITGANFVTADTGTIVIVTNEGNADLCTLIPRVHVAVVPVEKVIPRLADLATLLPVLTRSATGQDVSNYLTMVTGPRRAGEVDGPEELHVVFLDHGRLRLVGTDYEDMLACIRCGACLNVCPVFRRISGHAYDAVYTGPMGKILTPLLDETGTEGRDLPGASSLCGACAEACPVEIPLPDLLVRLRADLRAPGGVRPRPLAAGPRAATTTTATAVASARRPGEGLATAANAAPLVGTGRPSGTWRAWATLWSSPRGYRWSVRLASRGSRLLGHGWTRGAIPGTAAWRRSRDLPLPAPRSFRDRWHARGDGAW
jgi:L-lactate dehydrogenase complex protein LldF